MDVRKYSRGSTVAVLVLALVSAQALAGEADVLDVTVTKSGDTYRFSVTVAHDDTGWEHYADKWDVVAPDGTVLGTRVLLHPHETEQPFTRSLDGIAISPGINRVTIRAHDKIHGYGGKTVTITLPE